VTVLYADTSAVVGAYLADEDDHAALRAQLREDGRPVLTSALARLEWTSAIHAAVRAGRLAVAEPLLVRLEGDAAEGGPITLLRLDLAGIADAVRALLARHPLRTLDAIHLAVALEERELTDDEVVLVSRDDRQQRAARAEGLRLL